MEHHASTVEYLPTATLKIYGKTQGVQELHALSGRWFDMKGQIQITFALNVGGALVPVCARSINAPLARQWAALKLKRSPVRVRPKNATDVYFGYRRAAVQRLPCAPATASCKAFCTRQLPDSRFEDFTEQEVE